MKKKQPMTQTEIARQLGLSQRTVSQAFCGTGRLSQQTRDKILSYARKVGYRPNFSAQSIRNGKQNRIGLFMGLEAHRSPLPVKRLQGMQVAAHEERVSLVICTNPDRDIDRDLDLGRLLGGFGVDAMLVNYALDISEEMNNMLKHFHVPTITINSKLPFDCIHPDDRAIAFLVGESLVRSTKAPILYVGYGTRPASRLPGGRMPVHYSEIDRIDGLKQAAYKHGGEICFQPVTTFADTGMEWLNCKRSGSRPVIVCYNETIAMRVYIEACRGGLFAEEDFTIVHFASQRFSDQSLDDALKPIMLPEFEIGYRAVKMLLERQRSGNSLATEAITLVEIPVLPNMTPSR